MGEANLQGKLLLDLMCRTNLFAASLCSISSGPSYTYFSGAHRTTVDYCLLDNHAAHILQGCVTLDHHPLNTSPYQLVSISPHSCKTNPLRNPKINWKRANLDGSIARYQQHVSTYFSDLLTHHNSCDLSMAEKSVQLDHEIQSSAEAIVQAAQHSLPFFRPRRQKKKYVNDASLHEMCCASKAAWVIWRNGGCPQSGPMYELMPQRKKDVRSYVRSCRAREERSRLQERDRLFCDRDSRRFFIPRNNTSGRKLVVDDKVVSDEHELLNCWANHFIKSVIITSHLR